MVGVIGGENDYFEGKIEDLRFFHQALSANEIVRVFYNRIVVEDEYLIATGDLNFTDVDANNNDDVWQIQTDIVSSYGSYSIDVSGNWTYNLDNSHTAVQALNTGETLIDSFTVLTGDGISEVISITINGLNENIAIITGTKTGTVTEDGTLIATGDLDHTDIDINNNDDVWQVQTDIVSSYGSYSIDSSGNWTYNLDNSHTAVQALNTGEILTDTFTTLTEDGTTQELSITINGLNENILAEITGIITGTVTEDGTLIATGDLDHTDIDSNNNDDVWQVQTDIVTSYGSYSIDSSGNWTYNLDNSHTAVQALNTGEILTDTFTTLTEDGTTQELSITINGADEVASTNLDDNNIEVRFFKFIISKC